MTGDVYVEADSTAVLICVRKVEMAFSHAEQPFWHDMCVCTFTSDGFESCYTYWLKADHATLL